MPSKFGANLGPDGSAAPSGANDFGANNPTVNPVANNVAANNTTTTSPFQNNNQGVSNQAATTPTITSPNDPLHPSHTVASSNKDIILGNRPQKNLKPVLVIAVIALVLILTIAILVMVLSGKKPAQSTSSVGEINTAILFDDTAPIPAASGSNYGYINPEDGSQVINPQFLSAERFYGDYAVTQTGSGDHIVKTAIINRAGEEIFAFEGENFSTYYDASNNIWLIDGDTYDSNMQKLSPDGTISQYIGHGYLLVQEKLAESTQNSPATQNSEREGDGGSSSAAVEDVDAETAAYNNTYISLLDGQKVYDCGGICSAFTLESEGKTYAVVRIWGSHSQIVDLSNGETIYSTNGGTISQSDEDLVEQTDNGEKYLQIQNNKVTTSSTPYKTTAATISGAGEYLIESCESDKYIIKTASGENVGGCDIDAYYELPLSLYRALQNNFDETPVLILRDNTLQLFDMRTAKVSKAYAGQDVVMADNSPFLYIQNLDTGENFVCNVLNKHKKDDASCLNVGEQSEMLDAYGNYFILDNGEAKHFYNSELKEIR